MSRPRWYFSLRSPYSWLAYRELLDRRPEVLEEVEWIPFWEPDEDFARLLAETDDELPYVPMSRAKSLYILQDVRRLAAERALRPAWPVDRAPHWEVAHLAYLVAAEHGAGPAFVDEAYRARWERGDDLSDPGTVAGLGDRIGVDGALLAGATGDPRIRRRGLDCLRSACADGVFGVPYFIVGHDRYWGVDRVRQFVAALHPSTPAAPETSPEPATRPEQGTRPDPDTKPEPDTGAAVLVAAAAGPDTGHAGGCG